MSAVALLRAYPNRWGEGKVHLDAGYKSAMVPDCRRNAMTWIHAEPYRGPVTDITCQLCRKLVNL